MPLLGPIDEFRVLGVVKAEIEVALHLTLKDPALRLVYDPDYELFAIFKGPDSLWTGRDIAEAVALYNQYAGFTKPPAEDYDFV